MSLGYPEIGAAVATVGAEAANAITVSFQLYSDIAATRELAKRGFVGHYLSSDANGDTPVAAQTSIAAGADGAIVGAWTAAQSGCSVSESDGDLDLVVTDTGTSTRYLHLINLGSGEKLVTATLPFA